MPYSKPLQLQLFPDAGELTRDGATAAPAAEPAPPDDAPAAVADAGRAATGRATDRAAAGGVAKRWAGRDLLARLERRRPGRFRSVTLTDNRSTIVSARERPSGLEVRIHRCFAEAPPAAVDAVADFLLGRKRGARRREALAAIREHFRRQAATPGLTGPRAPEARRRRLVLRPVGRALDLRQVRDALNERFFGGELAVRITWGRAPSRRRRRCGYSVRLGTYSERDNLVRVHRCLDRADVPRYVVEAVVYHEMLHAAVPPVVENGRRRIHTPEFRRRERLFRRHDRAERWLERHLPRLIGAR